MRNATSSAASWTACAVPPSSRSIAPARPPSMEALARDLLAGCGFSAPFADLAGDAARVGCAIEEALAPGARLESVEVAAARLLPRPGRLSRGPHLRGRAATCRWCWPCATRTAASTSTPCCSRRRGQHHLQLRPLLLPRRGRDARALVRFLKSIMPLKPIAELYISLGYNKHGKTELYRDLMRHLARSTDQFVIAPGERGMVMVGLHAALLRCGVQDHQGPLRLPRRPPPARDVIKQLPAGVQARPRRPAGRRAGVRASALRPGPLRARTCSPSCSTWPAHTVSVEGDEVVIKHLYTERRLTPLNLYIQQAPPEQAAEA